MNNGKFEINFLHLQLLQDSPHPVLCPWQEHYVATLELTV